MSERDAELKKFSHFSADGGTNPGLPEIEDDIENNNEVAVAPKVVAVADEGESENLGGGISLAARLRDPKTLAGFGISAVILVFFVLTVKIDFAATFSNILKANLLYLLAGFAIYYFAFYIRGLRWRMLLRNAGFEQENKVRLPGLPGLIEIIFLSWFVNCLVPAKLGDAYRGYLLKKNANASFSRTLGTIFAERIADVLVLFGLLCLGGLVAFSSVESKLSSIYLVFVFGMILVVGIVIGLVVLRFYSHQIARFVPSRFQPIFHRFQEGTVSSFRRDTQLKLYAMTMGIWLCEGARLYFVMQSLNVSLGLSVVIFIALASSLLTTLPFTPAGLGAVEGTIVVVLTTFAIDKNLASSVAILDRVVSYWLIIVFGAILYIVSRKK